MSLPDPTPVLDLIHAFRLSKTMFTAVSMGIFDRLHEASARAADLAVALGAHPEALERLLDSCAALSLLHKHDGVYRNQPVAETYLCSASPQTLSGYIRYSDEALYPMWGKLEDAVREGTHRWQQTFGWEGPIFSHFFRPCLPPRALGLYCGIGSSVVSCEAASSTEIAVGVILRTLYFEPTTSPT